jgi:hypothetical protein
MLNVCRAGCQTHADCLPNEGCVTEYFPGDGGLCVRTDCDYDRGLAQGDVAFDVESYGECACLPWELAGGDFERRDKCVYALHVGIGETCFDGRAWCNARGETAERSGVAGVCLQQSGESDFTCRQLCRSGADCGVGTSCVDVTDTLGAERVQDLVDDTDYYRRFSTIRLCIPD